jgi:transposase
MRGARRSKGAAPKSNKKKGQKFLGVWIMDAFELVFDYERCTGSTVLKPLKKLAKSLLGNMKGILNYFDYRISNGKMEGINNKIKTLKRQAYGYRDKEYFRLLLLHLHAQKVRISG